jgi:hypothetical protein
MRNLITIRLEVSEMIQIDRQTDTIATLLVRFVCFVQRMHTVPLNFTCYIVDFENGRLSLHRELEKRL